MMKALRLASTKDIPLMHAVRIAVKENRLSDPLRITHEMYHEYLCDRGKGWVYEIGDEIVGFAIVDVIDHSVWALFVHPEHEGKGVGRALHDVMLRWYFEQTQLPLRLSTAPGTRAEYFYRNAGWEFVGMKGNEMVFEFS